jgi:phosphate transport system ATP-binding protein
VDTKTVGQVTVEAPVITARHVNVHYSEKHAIKDVSIDVARNSVIASSARRVAASPHSCAA